MSKIFRVVFLVLAAAGFVVGALGVYSGVRDVLAGGYADSIFLGVVIMTAHPAGCLMAYKMLKEAN